jgi:hypothetical protein
MSKDKECKCGGNCKCANKTKLESLSVMANDMESWLDNLESKEQPKACSIDDEDCEACGS